MIDVDRDDSSLADVELVLQAADGSVARERGGDTLRIGQARDCELVVGTGDPTVPACAAAVRTAIVDLGTEGQAPVIVVHNPHVEQWLNVCAEASAGQWNLRPGEQTVFAGRIVIELGAHLHVSVRAMLRTSRSFDDVWSPGPVRGWHGTDSGTLNDTQQLVLGAIYEPSMKGTRMSARLTHRSYKEAAAVLNVSGHLSPHGLPWTEANLQAFVSRYAKRTYGISGEAVLPGLGQYLAARGVIPVCVELFQRWSEPAENRQPR